MNKRWLVLSCLFAAVIAPLRGETLIAFTSDRKLNFFESTAPGTYTRTVNIVGLGLADIMLSAACTPTGQLFLLTRAGSNMTVRLIDPQTGTILQGNGTIAAYPSAATNIGMDVDTANPGKVDIVHDADEIQSLELNGFNSPIPLFYDNTVGDGDPVDVHAGANPAVVGLAHTNNFPGAESSVFTGSIPPRTLS